MRYEQGLVHFSFEHWQSEDIVKKILDYNHIDICKLISIYQNELTFISSLDDPSMQTKSCLCMGQLLEKQRIKELIIVGWEENWDEIVPAALPPSLQTIWFVHENEDARNAFLKHHQHYKDLYFMLVALLDEGVLIPLASIEASPST
jgi:hypothetical protein